MINRLHSWRWKVHESAHARKSTRPLEATSGNRGRSKREDTGRSEMEPGQKLHIRNPTEVAAGVVSLSGGVGGEQYTRARRWG